VDPGLCCESLATLFSQEFSSLNELAGLLEREHALLVANDVETLEKAMQERQVVVGRLLDIEEERRSLCRAHGKPADTTGLAQLIDWCDPRGTLKTRMTDSANGATRCRELNDRNGALVLARMKRVEGLLGALTGQRPEAPATYGPKGLYAVPRSGRVLTTEA
jgi:flagellar biosynthesis/type III secretory pathway chaperone